MHGNKRELALGQSLEKKEIAISTLLCCRLLLFYHSPFWKHWLVPGLRCPSIQFFYFERHLPALEFAAGRSSPWTWSIRQTLAQGKGRNICCHHEQLVGRVQPQSGAKQLICFPTPPVWLADPMWINTLSVAYLLWEGLITKALFRWIPP